VPLIEDLHADPYERASYEASDYDHWMIDRVYVLVPAQAFIGKFLMTFKEFPPRQTPASFNMDQVMEKLRAGVQSDNWISSAPATVLKCKNLSLSTIFSRVLEEQRRQARQAHSPEVTLMGKEIQTFRDFPSMQRGASFNLDARKAEMAKRMAEAESAAEGPSN